MSWGKYGLTDFILKNVVFCVSQGHESFDFFLVSSDTIESLCLLSNMSTVYSPSLSDMYIMYIQLVVTIFPYALISMFFSTFICFCILSVIHMAVW